MTKVLLIKSQKSDDPYIKVLEDNDYDGACTPALTFQYINLDKLAETLAVAEEYEGLILSSQNTVEACHKAQEASSSQDLLSKWVMKSNYAVGEATKLAAQTLLKLECLGSKSGNATNLVSIIQSERRPENTLKFLYPKTSLKTIDFTGQMAEHGFSVDELEVYNTLPDQNFEHNLAEYEKMMGAPRVIVFFSPSGVDHCLDAINLIFKDRNVQFIAVGPSTGAQLLKHGVHGHLVMEKPNAESLVKCLQKADVF